jgi:hypothetical protein
MHPELADLFFHYDNEHYWGFVQTFPYDKEELTKEKLLPIVTHDALEFCSRYPSIIKSFGKVEPEQLVSTFLERALG